MHVNSDHISCSGTLAETLAAQSKKQTNKNKKQSHDSLVHFLNIMEVA